MSNPLTALVIGAGYAGEGQTLALRRAGVQVLAMVGRTKGALRTAAERLEIPRHGTDWRSMIADLRPDIVAVCTPGGTHVEHCLGAIDAGCHVLCEKPLATTAGQARTIYLAARARGVRTAYAASYRYQPQVTKVRDLVQGGSMGRVLEVECVSHYHWPKTMPFGWPHRLDQGGGRLNNNFTHKLAIVQRVVGGEILEAMGEARNDLGRAPVAGSVHDFREYRTLGEALGAGADHEWAVVDSDWSYTVLVRLGPVGTERDRSTSATFRHSALALGKLTDYVAFYCEKGTIHIDGAYAQGDIHVATDGKTWVRQQVAQEDDSPLRTDVDPTFDNWNKLARDFVDDIRGRGYSGYPTFRDGWIYQQVIDVARSGHGWTPIVPD